MTYSVYMVRCSDSSLYTGVAKDPHQRVLTHNAGKGAKYTRSRLPVKLVWSQVCDSKGLALSMEYSLKQMSKAEKEKLLEGDASEIFPKEIFRKG